MLIRMTWLQVLESRALLTVKQQLRDRLNDHCAWHILHLCFAARINKHTADTLALMFALKATSMSGN